MVEQLKKCFRCGTEIMPGGLAYQVHIEMAADFDGYIDGDSPEMALPATLTELDSMSHRSAEDFLEEVYRERKFLFCQSCAEKIWHYITKGNDKTFIN